MGEHNGVPVQLFGEQEQEQIGVPEFEESLGNTVSLGGKGKDKQRREKEKEKGEEVTRLVKSLVFKSLLCWREAESQSQHPVDTLTLSCAYYMTLQKSLTAIKNTLFCLIHLFPQYLLNVESYAEAKS